MATNGTYGESKTIQLSAGGSSGYTHTSGLSKESAAKTSDLLTKNHELYHTRFNAGFHNHIVHHLLALFALGASPDEIQDMWEFNKRYQVPLERDHDIVSEYRDLKDPEMFKKCLGNDDCYADFLRFFEDEVAEKGVPAVVKEYVFKGDERADDIFCRMYTDLVHPMIHLGCALEFNQPSLVAEALAAACVHDNWPKEFLLPTEEYVRSNAEVSSKSLLEVLEGLHKDPKIASAVQYSDPFNKIRDGLIKRITGDEFAPHLGQYQVKPTPEDLQRKMTDMMYACAYMMGAAQRPGKREALDFVLLHNVTLSVFYPAFLSLDWLTNEDKVRLIEAKGRVDAVMYAGSGSPELYAERIVDYVPRHPEHGWPEIIHRSIIHRDEGHVAKLVRALYCLEQLEEPEASFPIAKSDFIKIAHMGVDSVERAFEPDGSKMPQPVADAIVKDVGKGGDMVISNMIRWVFYGGLDKSWQYVPELGQVSA